MVRGEDVVDQRGLTGAEKAGDLGECENRFGSDAAELDKLSLAAQA